jgi:hypothetical protein
MTKEFRVKSLGSLLTALGIAIVFVPFSVLLGWNIVTLVLFWLVITPALAIYIPTRVSKNPRHLFESLTGLSLFYAVIIFMIYEHYKSDYFQMMMVSYVLNIIMIVAIHATRKART